jgi:uncharacterized damage-inducible protein DinB
MTVPDYYTYLVRARRDLWAFLETVPNEVLSKPVLPGERFHCIKDLVLHIAAVEDSWLHEDILRDQPIWEITPDVEGAKDGPFFADMQLTVLIAYWRAVEQNTLAYLERLNPAELERRVTVPRAKGDEHFTVDGLLWHVMQHETRHTAQIAVLIRQAGFEPPFLDLLNYLPSS